MASHGKKAQLFARQLFRMSLVDGSVSPDRVSGVLEYIEKHRPPNPLMVLKAYHRYVEAELSRSQAVVEHAGAVHEATLASIAAAMTRKYKRSVTAAARPNAALLAGLRIRIGDDVYEASIAGQLAALGASL